MVPFAFVPLAALPVAVPVAVGLGVDEAAGVAVLDEPWVVALPLSAPAPSTLDELAHLTWLGTDPAAAAHRATGRLLAGLDTTPRVAHLYSDIDVAISMVSALCLGLPYLFLANDRSHAVNALRDLEGSFSHVVSLSPAVYLAGACTCIMVSIFVYIAAAAQRCCRARSC